MTFKLSDGWKVPSRDICWLETVAIELLIYILKAKVVKNLTLLIHSDNQGAIGALDKGRSRNYHINLFIRRLYTILIPRFITPQLKFVPSEDNPADPILRGEPGSPDFKLPYSFGMPDELKPIFHHGN